MQNISKKIRKVCGKKIPLPTFFIILMALILILCPFINIFHPTTIDDIYNIETNDSYVNVTADTLYYSGYNLIKTSGKNYGYYYTLKDERCVFVIIPVDEAPDAIIHDYTFKAKVIKPNKSYNKMLSAFAKDLNWNEKALSEVSENFILSNADYHPAIYMILLWTILVILLISGKKLLDSFCGFINPALYPVCPRLEKHARKELIEHAQYELSGENCLQINSMYITENYFIDLGKTNISVIPLKEILWCYRLGTLSFHPLKYKPHYALYFTLLNGAVIVAKHKTDDAALKLINAIRATKYDIIIGHSHAKRKMVKKICKKSGHSS